MTNIYDKLNNIDDFNTIKDTKKPFILYFWSEDCGVCNSMGITLEETKENIDIPIYKINIKEDNKISAQNLVFTVPTILVFYDGKEVLRESRYIDFNNVKKVLEIVVE